MKVLIWILCVLPAAILFAILENNGILLGPLPKTLIAASSVAIAIKVCKNIDKKKKENEDQDQDKH